MEPQCHKLTDTKVHLEKKKACANSRGLGLGNILSTELKIYKKDLQ